MLRILLTPVSIQKENEDIKNKIYALLKDSKKQMTITEFQNTYEEFSTTKYSNQKLNALFTQLKNENKIVRIQDKKKTYFYVEVAR